MWHACIYSDIQVNGEDNGMTCLNYIHLHTYMLPYIPVTPAPQSSRRHQPLSPTSTASNTTTCPPPISPSSHQTLNILSSKTSHLAFEYFFAWLHLISKRMLASAYHKAPTIGITISKSHGSEFSTQSLQNCLATSKPHKLHAKPKRP